MKFLEQGFQKSATEETHRHTDATKRITKAVFAGSNNKGSLHTAMNLNTSQCYDAIIIRPITSKTRNGDN